MKTLLLLLLSLNAYGEGLLHKEDPYEEAQFMEATPEDEEAIPDSWSVLDLGKAKQVKVNTQRCGDCWSQATTKAFEVMIAAHDEKVEKLSVQTQISSCRPDYGSCSGGYPSAADFLVAIGNPFEKQDPYQGRNSSCKFTKAELEAGFDYKLDAAPYVGSSMAHSRFYKDLAGYTAGSARAIAALMYKYQSPAVVTVNAYQAGPRTITNCSAINSQGNHMVFVSGWENKAEIAHVFNSWGKSHGTNGISKIKWECGGAGRFNRGLGVSARVYLYGPKCHNVADAYTGPNVTIKKGETAVIGRKAKVGQTCEWLPEEGLAFTDESKCEALAAPAITTEYHLKATTECGTASAMVLVTPEGEESGMILTPLGKVKRK